MDRIKELMTEWATWSIDRQKSYPSQSAFATERVQSSNRSADTFYDDAPEIIIKLNKEIEKFAPPFKKIISLEYMHHGPQKSKAAKLGIPRQVYSDRLRWILVQLDHVMFFNVS